MNFSALRYFGHRTLRRFGKAANHGHCWDSIKPRRVLPRLASSRQKSPASKGDEIKRPVKLGHDCARPAHCRCRPPSPGWRPPQIEAAQLAIILLHPHVFSPSDRLGK